MSEQWWSWILTAVGLTGFVLAGKKVWWSWYVNLFCQGLWFAYAIVTNQYGFIVASIAYSVVFSQNAYKWTKEHRENSVSTISNTPVCPTCKLRPYTRLRLWLAARVSIVSCPTCGRRYAVPESHQEIIDG